MEEAEREHKPGIDSLFSDVYDKLPQQLKKQRDYMIDHLNKYSIEYPKYFQK